MVGKQAQAFHLVLTVILVVLVLRVEVVVELLPVFCLLTIRQNSQQQKAGSQQLS